MMHQLSGVALLLAVFLISSESRNAAAQDQIDVSVSVDAGDAHQLIEGFGATTLSLVYATDYLSPDMRARALQAVYGDVGLNMGTLVTGWPEWPSNDNNDPFLLESSNMNWSGSVTMKEKVVDPAAPLGFDNFNLAPTINLRWELPWLKDIRENGEYDLYLNEAAEHVLAELRFWNDEFGIRPRNVSIFNEPLSGNSELDGGTTTELIDLVKRVGSRIESEGFGDVGIIVPNGETVSETLTTAQQLLADAEARQYVSAIAYHVYPYGSEYSSVARILELSGSGMPSESQISLRTQLRDLANQYGVQVWMTEASMGPGANRKDFPFGSIENLRARAIHIHDEFRYAGASAFFGMNNMWDLKAHKDHFNGSEDFLTEQSTIALVNNEAEEVHISGMGYAIGHYARWIRRGVVRIESESDDPLVQVSAFRDDENGQIILVLLNNRGETSVATITVLNAMTGGILTGEVSDQSRRWDPVESIPLDSGEQPVLSLAPYSVTTIAVPIVQFTSRDDRTDLPTRTQLIASYPNPFDMETTISFEVSRLEHARLSVHDALGREVGRPLDRVLSPGYHHVVYDGSTLTHGVYFIVLQTEGRLSSVALVKH